MIDARRMEVFTAVYNNNLEEIMSPCAMVLDENSFFKYLQNNQLLFTGNGSAKWHNITKHVNAHFMNITQVPAAFATLSHQYFANKQFTDLAYSSPFYIKEFKDNG